MLTNGSSRDRLVNAILAFLAGQDLLSLDDIEARFSALSVGSRGAGERRRARSTLEGRSDA
jgi:hypothetical protein